MKHLVVHIRINVVTIITLFLFTLFMLCIMVLIMVTNGLGARGAPQDMHVVHPPYALGAPLIL